MALVLGGVWMYYRLVWVTLAGFVKAVDNYELFADFARHYYPMGRQIGTLAFPYPVDGFYYSAFFAIILEPVARLTLPSAMWVWGACEVVLTLALAVVPTRGWLTLRGWRFALYVLLFTTSLPVLHNFKFGQVSVLVTLTMLLSLRAHMAGRPVAAGAWLALGGSIKYYAAGLVLYYLFRRQWRVIGAFVIAGVGMVVVVPSIVIGPMLTFQFHREAAEALAAIGHFIEQDWNSQFLPHVILRLLHVVDSPRAVLALFVAGLVVPLANAGIVWRLRKSETLQAAALSFAALLLSLPFLLSTSWPHYLVYLPCCQAVVVAGLLRMPSRPSRHVLVAAAVTSMFLSSVFALNLVGQWAAFVWPGPFLWADVLLIPGVFALTRAELDATTNAARA